MTEGWQIMVLAAGWVLVFEGFTPLVAPARWKRMVSDLTKATDAALRAAAGLMVAVGVILVWTVLGGLPTG